MRARHRKFPTLYHQTDCKNQAATRIGDATPMFQGTVGDAVNGMVGDTADHFAQIGFRIEAIELGGFDKRMGYGSGRHRIR